MTGANVEILPAIPVNVDTNGRPFCSVAGFRPSTSQTRLFGHICCRSPARPAQQDIPSNAGEIVIHMTIAIGIEYPNPHPIENPTHIPFFGTFEKGPALSRCLSNVLIDMTRLHKETKVIGYQEVQVSIFVHIGPHTGQPTSATLNPPTLGSLLKETLPIVHQECVQSTLMKRPGHGGGIPRHVRIQVTIAIKVRHTHGGNKTVPARQSQRRFIRKASIGLVSKKIKLAFVSHKEIGVPIPIHVTSTHRIG